MSLKFASLLISFCFWGIFACQEPPKEIKPKTNYPAIRVRLLNGCGVRGATKSVRMAWDKLNVDIISDGNAGKFIYDKSLIVVRKADATDLKRLSEITGIKRRIYAFTLNPEANFDIILGNDYMQYTKQEDYDATGTNRENNSVGN